MKSSFQRELAALEQLGSRELRDRYEELFGEPPLSGHRRHLLKRIAWRLQALAEGDLTERARRRADELASDADVRLTAPQKTKDTPKEKTSPRSGTNGRDPRLPAPGTVLARRYKGRLLEVEVRAEGFEFEGHVYRTLSAVAKVVTGAHWNGHLFFGLRRNKTSGDQP